MKQTFKELFQNKANPETVYNRYNLPKEDRVVLDKVLNKVLTEGIDIENESIEINEISKIEEEPTYLRHTHYITNNATGGYYVQKGSDFELIEYNNATIELKLDSDYSGNYKEGYALVYINFPGSGETEIKNSRSYIYDEISNIITVEGVLQGTGSYNPLTERKDIVFQLTDSGKKCKILNEYVISTTSPNAWTDGLIELNGIDD